MASARKKQDEKHLKILRDLVSNPPNRQCFDCHQRGPTYVNMAIGSFVCTSCSGLLRGLTPPHRVKSISMATFTPEEIEMISSRGNEYCRRIWLGLYEPGRLTDTRDEQGIKDFMIAKYEKKRYYIDPSMANLNGAASVSQAPSPNSTLNKSNISISSNAASAMSPIKPLSTLVGSVTLPALSTVSQPIPAAPNSFTPDDSSSGFLVDFGSLSASSATSPEKKVDPFGLPATVPPNNTSSNLNFADFDNNPIFGASNGIPSGTSLPTSQSFPGVSRKLPSDGGNAFQQPPSEDRYAALKDLDSLMKSQQSEQTSVPSSTCQADWGNAPSASPSWSAFGTSPQLSGFSSAFAPDGNSASVMSNPFTSSTSNPWSVSDGAIANPFLASQTRQTEPSVPFSWNGTGPSVGLNGTSSVNGIHVTSSPFSTSQSLTFPSKSWKAEQTGNPFVMGPAANPGSHSKNPFL